MEEHLTTRQVAEALSVSESSVKRWCDSGDIPTERTVGGHRRIPLDTFLEFLERTNRRVVSSLLPRRAQHVDDTVPTSRLQTDLTVERFQTLLVEGDENSARKLLTSVYAENESFAWLADAYIAKSMHLMGNLWDCGDLEVYQERRGCEICSRLIYELGRLVPAPARNAPLALGGAPEGDNYSLPSQVVQLVFRESGWRAMNLGNNLPLKTLSAAANEHKPRMVWLSVSHLNDTETFISEFAQLSDALPDDTMVVVGGRALGDDVRPRMKYTGHCDNMQQLAAFARALHGRRHSIESSEN
ncbi:MAG: helix-turn-helix domain-containing protein [Planctomycetota bacterium]|nr:helix-turn-helix domain-containing protein [Planctomycetota bacterium]